MKFNSAWSCFGAVSLLALAANAAVADTKVGLLVPNSGTYAALGKELVDGFNLAISESGLKGITVLVEDTEAKPNVGLEKAKKLVLEDNVDVLSGIVSSAVLSAARDFVDGAKVPLIVSNAGNNSATGAACSKYIMRVSFSNDMVHRPMGTYLAAHGVKKVYLLAPDYAAGHEAMDAFKRTFKEGGGEIVGEEYTAFGKTDDFSPFLTNAQAAKPDAIYVFYSGGEAIKFTTQYKSFGIDKTLPLYSAGFLDSPMLLKAEGDAADGLVTGLHYMPSLDTPENKSFKAAYEKQTGRPVNEFAVQGYDSGRLLVEALKSGASGREGLAAALPKMKFNGPRGPLQIDPATNNIVQNYYIFKTVKTTDGFTQQLLETVPNLKDPANGCKL